MTQEQATETAPRPSRYARMQAILDEAASGAAASYQGYERFWHLPLVQLLMLELYGIRMIAPAASPAGRAAAHEACCHGAEPAGDATSQPAPGRGAASGLVRGLRGQFPFDGSQFPPLPWGGKRVAESDIQFIAQWIDDGCPAEDVPPSSAVEVRASQRLARAQGQEAHPPHAGPLNAFHDDSGSLKVRKNVAYLSADELQRLRAAITQMKSLDTYYQDERSFGFWARIHANNCQHGWEEFLTWHRAYLYLFEQQLQDIDPTVTLPYWDWPLDRADVEKSIDDMGSDVALDNGVIPEAYRCWIDDTGLQRLAAGGQVPAAVLEQLATIRNRACSSGNRLFLAAGITYGQNQASDAAIMQELARINPLWHRLRWPGGNKSIIFEVYPTPEDIANILQIDNFFTFGSGPSNDHFFGALENIHNLIHNFSGGINPHYVPGTPPQNRDEPQTGDMVNAGVTAYDPIFWGHHSNVDRLWAAWQQLHPTSGPDDSSAVLPPWPMTVAQTYSIHNLGYEYMQSSYLFPTDNSLPMQRFRSTDAGVQPQVLSSHRRAEVRLHKVQYVTRPGFHVRVFLNQADANVNTPTHGNDHYVGQFNMFTGLCIGGPGHCAVPSEVRRKFDHRPRPHKTPGNFRLDATPTVQKLLAQGAPDLQVHLVVFNTDGTPAHDALVLDAVSLNFFD